MANFDPNLTLLSFHTDGTCRWEQRQGCTEALTAPERARLPVGAVVVGQRQAHVRHAPELLPARQHVLPQRGGAGRPGVPAGQAHHRQRLGPRRCGREVLPQLRARVCLRAAQAG